MNVNADLPEFRFGANNFCLLYALHPTPKGGTRIQMRYLPRARSDWFIVGRCHTDWDFSEYQGFDSLELTLLWARERYHAGMRGWTLRPAEPKTVFHSPQTLHEKKYAAILKRLEHLLEGFGNFRHKQSSDSAP